MNIIPHYWEQAKAELSAADEKLAGVIAQFPDEAMQSRGDAFHTLARSIVGQQISVKAADSVWAKFENFMVSSCGAQRSSTGSLDGISIDSVQSLCDSQNDEALRACGLSRQKVTYLNEISSYFIENEVSDGFFAEMTDQEVIKALTSIKGIGVWTAEMFLMFHLLRPNVLPLDDIGLQRGIERLYKNGKKTTKKQYIAISKKWSPWRSVATWYLWRSLDPVAVEY